MVKTRIYKRVEHCNILGTKAVYKYVIQSLEEIKTKHGWRECMNYWSCPHRATCNEYFKRFTLR